MPAIPARVIATSLALVGFAGAVVVGLAAGNEPLHVLIRATLMMFACLIFGAIIGRVAQRTIDLHVERHKQKNPIPEREGTKGRSSTGSSNASQAEQLNAA